MLHSDSVSVGELVATVGEIYFVSLAVLIVLAALAKAAEFPDGIVPTIAGAFTA